MMTEANEMLEMPAQISKNVAPPLSPSIWIDFSAEATTWLDYHFHWTAWGYYSEIGQDLERAAYCVRLLMTPAHIAKVIAKAVEVSNGQAISVIRTISRAAEAAGWKMNLSTIADGPVMQTAQFLESVATGGDTRALAESLQESLMGLEGDSENPDQVANARELVRIAMAEADPIPAMEASEICKQASLAELDPHIIRDLTTIESGCLTLFRRLTFEAATQPESAKPLNSRNDPT